MLSPGHYVPTHFKLSPRVLRAANPDHFAGGLVEKRSDNFFNFNAREVDVVLRDGKVTLIMYDDSRLAYRALDLVAPCKARPDSTGEFLVFAKDAAGGERQEFVFRASKAKGARSREEWMQGIKGLLERRGGSLPSTPLAGSSPTAAAAAGPKAAAAAGPTAAAAAGAAIAAAGDGASAAATVAAAPAAGASSGAGALPLPPSPADAPAAAQVEPRPESAPKPPAAAAPPAQLALKTVAPGGKGGCGCCAVQ